MGRESKYKGWVTPERALDRAKKKFGERLTATHALSGWLKDGMIGAVATDLLMTRWGHADKRTEFSPLGPVFWVALKGTIDSHFFWKTGSADVFIDDDDTRYSAHGLLFDPDALDKYLGPEPAAATEIVTPKIESLPSKHAGGAPRKEFWDDLWLAMFERLWMTEWKPKNQAEIETAMLNWAAKNGYKLGPTSVKIPAGKLLELSRK